VRFGHWISVGVVARTPLDVIKWKGKAKFLRHSTRIAVCRDHRMFTCPSGTIGSITRVSLRVLVLVGFLFSGVSKMKDKDEKAVNLLAAPSNV